MWKLYRDESGQIKFRKLLKDKPQSPSGPFAIDATIPRRVLEDKDRLRKLVDAIGKAGGGITSSSGRMVSMVADASSVDEIGDALDSFGCQWDAQKQ